MSSVGSWDEFLADRASRGCRGCGPATCTDLRVQTGPNGVRASARLVPIAEWCGRVDFVAGDSSGVQVRVPCMPDDAGHVSFDWDGTRLELRTGSGAVPLLPVRGRVVGERKVAGAAYARLEGESWAGSEFEVWLDFVSEHPARSAVRDRLVGYTIQRRGQRHPVLARLVRGTRIRPILDFDGAGAAARERLGAARNRQSVVVDKDDAVDVRRTPVSGRWYVGFEATNHDGATLGACTEEVDLPPR
jgi:hypothetical protein